MSFLSPVLTLFNWNSQPEVSKHGFGKGKEKKKNYFPHKLSI